MAKKSSINNNDKKRKLVANKKTTREALVSVIKNKNTSFDDRMVAVHKLAEMPRNSSHVRVRNRCVLTGDRKSVV